MEIAEKTSLIVWLSEMQIHKAYYIYEITSYKMDYKGPYCN